MMRRLMIATTLLACCAMASPAWGQGYPSKPVKVMVPWPPGQSTDVVVRLVVEKMATNLRQPMVVENKPGAAGTIATEATARAPGDGYTLLAASSGPVTIAPHVQKVGYDPLRDFEPICLVSSNPYVLVVPAGAPYASVGDLHNQLRANPGRITYASSGNGSTSHLVSEAFKSAAKVDAVHVPYKGSPPAVTDLIGGHVAFAFETPSTVVPHLRAGRLKGLAVTTALPSPLLSDLPTIADSLRLPGFDLRGWSGIMVPAGTPREVRTLLAAECRKALESPDIRERFAGMGVEPGQVTGDEFLDFLQKQSERFAAIAKQANVRID